MTKILAFLSSWLSKSGDHTFWSWVITITYIAVVVLSIYSLKKIKSDKTLRLLWICITIFLTIMGINKQLDIQILLIMVGRFMARHLNLSGYSYYIRIIVVIGLFAVMALLTAIILFKTRTVLQQSFAAISGVAILMIFVLIRALSFYIYKIHGLELLGLILILVDRIIFLRNLKAEP